MLSNIKITIVYQLGNTNVQSNTGSNTDRRTFLSDVSGELLQCQDFLSFPSLSYEAPHQITVIQIWQ